MNKPARTAAFAAIALALSAAAFAASPPPVERALNNGPVIDDAMKGFDEMDRNSDGFLVPADLPPAHEMARNFAAADKDGDGRLTREEYEAFEPNKEGSEE